MLFNLFGVIRSFYLLILLHRKGLCLRVSIVLLPVGAVPLEFPILVDSWSLTFASTVLAITRAVIIFSKNYMAAEKFYLRFHLLVISFVGSILLLIFRPRIIALLIGWDGLGVTSYLLVIYFYSRKSLNAGIVTALSNRVGDCLLLISIAGVSGLVSWSPFFRPTFIWGPLRGLISVLLIWAAFTKRAQVPFSAWLPAAIAAPTPVSSLVHSSTLVTAGVYLLCRYSRLIHSRVVEALILPFGIATMLMAGVSALFETDIKKIVALSTLRQLGLIISALGVSLSQVAIFHLLTHAYFKALLFMTVGNIIHLTDRFQDSRKTGSEPRIIAPTLLFSLTANFRLIGLPFIAGFYSKDLIMEAPAVRAFPALVACLFYLATAFTAGYTVRFLLSIIAGKRRGPKSLWREDLAKDLPLANSILAPLAVIGGRLLSWLMLDLPSVNVIPNSIKNLTSCSILTGVLIGAIWWNKATNKVTQTISWNWGLMWSLPFRSTAYLLGAGLPIRQSYRALDLKWIPRALIRPVEAYANTLPAHPGGSFFNLRDVILVTLLLMLLLIW